MQPHAQRDPYSTCQRERRWSPPHADRGLAAATATAHGRKGRCPRKIADADAAKARQLREKGITASDIAKMLGVSRATVYRYLSDGVPLSA